MQFAGTANATDAQTSPDADRIKVYDWICSNCQETIHTLSSYGRYLAYGPSYDIDWKWVSELQKQRSHVWNMYTNNAISKCSKADGTILLQAHAFYLNKMAEQLPGTVRAYMSLAKNMYYVK
jgi:hypothetical protein